MNQDPERCWPPPRSSRCARLPCAVDRPGRGRNRAQQISGRNPRAPGGQASSHGRNAQTTTHKFSRSSTPREGRTGRTTSCIYENFCHLLLLSPRGPQIARGRSRTSPGRLPSLRYVPPTRGTGRSSASATDSTVNPEHAACRLSATGRGGSPAPRSEVSRVGDYPSRLPIAVPPTAATRSICQTSPIPAQGNPLPRRCR